MAEREKVCGCNTIKAIVQKSKYRSGEIEIVYKDPRFEVYSYELGDGIWGSSIDLLEGNNMEEAIKKYGEEALTKVLEEGEVIDTCVPISEILPKYSILDRKGKPIITSERDLSYMCFEGIVRLPDGSEVEPDDPRSPLREMGMI